MALTRWQITGAPYGEDVTHPACLHTLPVLSREQVLRRGRRSRRASVSAHVGGDLEQLEYNLRLPKLDPNARSEADYNSALHFACENHEIEAVRMLLDDGRIDADGRNFMIRTPAHVAAMVGDLEICKLLAGHLNALADLTLRDANDKTCWQLAAQRGESFPGRGTRVSLTHVCAGA